MSMFILTQLIGLYVVNFYMNDGISLPYGFDEQKNIDKTPSFYVQFLTSFIISFIIALVIILFLMKIKSLWFIRAWFFVVIALAIGITLNLITTQLGIIFPSIIALGLGIMLAYLKVFKKNILVHNLTELLIYPGIAAIFVTMLNLSTTVVLLIIISIYDIWAVWHSGVMQKMAKFQINSIGVFGGFFIPYASKKIKDKIKFLQIKYKNHKIPMNIAKKHKLKINLAILGGGDVVFPIIAAGVFLKTFHSIPASLCIVAGAALALLYLFIFGKKKKFYPAMPYLTAGIFFGMLLGYLFFI
jgi:presenilin-like A22 family membrane protease